MLKKMRELYKRVTQWFASSDTVHPESVRRTLGTLQGCSVSLFMVHILMAAWIG